jgi:hypothetical protein
VLGAATNRAAGDDTTVHRLLARITLQTVIYAVLSLTVVRMVPVAIATLGQSQRFDLGDPGAGLVRRRRAG